MAETVKVWFGPEGDFLKARFGKLLITCARRNMKPAWDAWTNREQVVYFSILGVGRFRQERPFRSGIDVW